MAEQAFKTGLTYDPHFCGILCNLANLYRKHGYIDKARECFAACDPLSGEMSVQNVAIYYNNVGMLEKTDGNYKLAAQYFQQAMEMLKDESNHVHAIMNNNYREVQEILQRQEQGS